MDEILDCEANVRAARASASEPSPELLAQAQKWGDQLRKRFEYWLFADAAWGSVDCKSCGGIGTKDGKTCLPMAPEELMGWPRCPDCSGYGSWMQHPDGGQKDLDGGDIRLPNARPRPGGSRPRGLVEREEL